jgi:hypothetical protein
MKDLFSFLFSLSLFRLEWLAARSTAMARSSLSAVADGGSGNVSCVVVDHARSARVAPIR